MSMQQIMRWWHDFQRITGVEYLTSEQMGRSQVSIGEPINYQPPFLVLFTNQLNSLGVSWAVISLGLGEYGQPPILAGLSTLTTCLPKGKVFSHYPHVEESSHTPLTPRRFSSCTHAHASIFIHTLTGLRFLMFFYFTLCFPSRGKPFSSISPGWEFIFVMINGWVPSPTI